MKNCELCDGLGHKYVTIWFNERQRYGYTGRPPYQEVMYPSLCTRCLNIFKKMDKVIFYDFDEFDKQMKGNLVDNTVDNMYISNLLVGNFEENEYLQNAYEIYNQI
jgi:hypothetical protein